MEVGGCKILGILYELLRNHLPQESHESVAMTPQPWGGLINSPKK